MVGSSQYFAALGNELRMVQLLGQWGSAIVQFYAKDTSMLVRTSEVKARILARASASLV